MSDDSTALARPLLRLDMQNPLPPVETRVRFGEFVFDPATGDLWRGSGRIDLRPQAARLLGLLVTRGGVVVPREEIQQLLWADTVVDYEAGINTCVRQLRTALGDTAETPRFIETAPRRGYRWLTAVHPIEGASPPVDSLRERSGSRPRWRLALAAAVLTGVLGVVPAASRALTRWTAGATTLVAVRPLATRGTIGEDRIAEAINQRLVQHLSSAGSSDVRPLPWQPGMHYDTTKRRVENRGQPTNADLLLTGSVFEGKGLIEVFVRLQEVSTGTEWWSRTFARPRGSTDSLALEVAAATNAAVRQTTER